MEKKINITKLLKDCPKGMELDCMMYDNCTFEGVEGKEDVGYVDILVKTPSGRIRLTPEGCYIRNDENAKCVIFPKGKTTWDGFVPPCKFKDGDVVATNDSCWVGITTGGVPEKPIPTYCVIGHDEFEVYLDKKEAWRFNRLATDEEKQKLFQAIKDNGYHWNAETKTLDKLITPKFKVGDRIRHKTTNKNDIYEISKVYDDCYGLVDFSWMVYIKHQDQYELVPNKFDITSLKHFNKVLIRDSDTQEWCASLFSHCNGLKSYKYTCMNGTGFKQCIPYENNEHLLGTTKDCDEYYKIWE